MSEESLASSAAKRIAPAEAERHARPLWCLEELTGRLVECSGGAPLTLAFDLVLDAQRQSEPVAWVSGRNSTFFPPDVDSTGVDLEALPVIRVRDAASAARAADHLLRSGAFGLVVVDLGRRAWVPMPLQSRLVGLAQKHGAAVLFLTTKRASAPSLSSLVSLRVESSREALTADGGGGRFRCGVDVQKDKRRGPNWNHRELHLGPPGLR